MDKLNEKTFGGLEDLLQAKHIDSGAMFAELDSFRFNAPIDADGVKPLFERTMGFIIIVRGTMDININHKMTHCTSTENNIVEFRATYAIYEMYISSDFRGYVVALSRSFMVSNMGFMAASTRLASFFTPDKYCYTVTSQDKQVILTALTHVERNMIRDSHSFFHELVVLSIIEAFLELINILFAKASEHKMGSRSTRRNELCHTFMNLVSEHGKIEHSVGFYADKLCITPQYLSKVLKKELGLSANKFIDVNLVSEATKMLRIANISIAEVVDALNFADQASFTKFFTKHTGTSPARFRKTGKSS